MIKCSTYFLCAMMFNLVFILSVSVFTFIFYIVCLCDE